MKKNKIVCTALQPGYIPWLGFFNLMERADIFVYRDDVQYDKSWRNRNRIKTNREAGFSWLTVPVKSSNITPLKEVEIDNRQEWQKIHWELILENYYYGKNKTLYFEEFKSFFEDVYLTKKWVNLVELDLYIIDYIKDYLKIKTEIVFASNLKLNHNDRTDDLIDICKQVNSNYYLSTNASSDYIIPEKFLSNNIELSYQNYEHPIYHQNYGKFIPYLSVIDLLFNEGPNSKKIIMKEPTVKKGDAMWEGKKILVTGGTNFIGSHLIDKLLNKGAIVTAIDNIDENKALNIRHNLANERFKYCKGNIMNKSLIEGIIKESEIIFHFAPVIGIYLFANQPLREFEINIKATKILLDFALKYGSKVVLASDSEVYGKNPKVPWSEEDDRVLGSTIYDRWIYATSKAVEEHLCFSYFSNGLSGLIFRLFNPFGPRLDEQGRGRVISIFTEQALAGEPITVIDDGSQTRCFTYIDDIVNGVLAGTEKKEAEGKIFNLGAQQEISMLKLAKMIKEYTDSSSEIKFVNAEIVYGKKYEDLKRRVPDVTKAKNIFGFEVTTSFETGLKKTIDWFKQTHFNRAAAK